MLITSIEHDPEPGPSNHPEPSGPRTRSRTKALPTPFGDLEYRKFTPLQDLRTPGQPLYQPASPNKWIDLTAFLPYLGEDPETETDEDEDMQEVDEEEASEKNVATSDSHISDDQRMVDEHEDLEAIDNGESPDPDLINKPVRSEVRLSGTEWATSTHLARSHELPERFKGSAVPPPPGTITFVQ